MSYTLSKTGAQIDNILNRADIGGAIDQSIALKAPLSSPVFTGTPAAPTPAEGDDSTQVATTEFVNSAIGNTETGTFPGMSVGASDNLISDAKISNSSPYLYRPVLNGVGNRAYSKLIGATIANNQLDKGINTTNYNVASGSATITDGLITATSNFIVDQKTVNKYRTIGGHKYLYMALAKSDVVATACQFFVYVTATGRALDIPTSASFVPVSKIFEGRDATDTINVQISGYTSGTLQVKEIELHDLTADFGSTIADYAYTLEQGEAGAGVAWLKSYGFFGKYAPYDAGSLISTKAEKKKVVGFNLFDEVMAANGISTGTGEVDPLLNTYIHSSFVPVIPNTTIYFRMSAYTGQQFRIFYYDADKNFVSYVNWTSTRAQTVPANVYFMRFVPYNNYGTTYKNDICINLSKTTGTPKNGDYVKHTSQEYDLGSDELRGLFKLDNGNIYADGDIKTPDGQITRKYGIVDLGSLNWEYISGANARFKGVPSAAAKSLGSSNYPNVICPNYPTTTYQQIYDASVDDVVGIGGDNNIYIRDTSYTDAATFKTAMNGVYLVYELATPTTETGTPFIDPSIVYPNGTEEYIDTRTVPVPMGNITEYTEDLKGGLETILDTPSANGTYVLKATVSGGVATLSWVSE